MIAAALLLALIGAGDLTRTALRSVRRQWESTLVLAAVWLVLVLLAVLGLGVNAVVVAAVVVLAALWTATTAVAVRPPHPAGVIPAVVLLAALVALLLWDRSASTLSGFLVDGHADAAASVLRDVPLPAVVMSVGATLFLVESANIIVRAALRPAIAPASDTPPMHAAVAPARHWWERRWWERRPEPAPTASATVADLKGGRLIGPLERLLIVALTLSGAVAIVGGILAAKGIVRFPEISHDTQGGSKAEYFLVGSLVSWAIAVLAIGAIWISAQG